MQQQFSFIFVFQLHAQCRNCTRVVDMTQRVPTFVKIQYCNLCITVPVQSQRGFIQSANYR